MHTASNPVGTGQEAFLSHLGVSTHKAAELNKLLKTSTSLTPRSP